jgi:hypothetical protein
MRRLVLVGAALALLAPPALAAAPSALDRYIAARDAYVETFRAAEKGTVGDATLAEHDKALADLTTLIAPVVGKVAIKGYGAKGRLNLDTLFPSDVGFGMLDGLVFATADGKATVLATTDGLLNRWLAGARDLPQDPAEALRSDEFYAQATSPDAAVLRYALVPILPPGGATTARAMLVLRAQDIGPGVPDEMLVAVMIGKRLFIASSPVKAKVTAIPACDEVWKGYETKMNEALAAYNKSDPRDDTLFEAYTKLEEQADRGFRGCYAEETLGAPFYKDLVKQAQAIANSLPR